MKKKFGGGFAAGVAVTQVWRAAKLHPDKVYLGGHRVHHGEAGIALALFGAVADMPRLVGFGTALALDDIADASQWFRETQSPETEYV